MVKALLIHKDDNVAVVISQVKENDEVVYVDKDNKSHKIIANGSIPQYHKMRYQSRRLCSYAQRKR